LHRPVVSVLDGDTIEVLHNTRLERIRFEPDLPLYMQVSRDRCVLHLSEHHGDCSPGRRYGLKAVTLMPPCRVDSKAIQVRSARNREYAMGYEGYVCE